MCKRIWSIEFCTCRVGKGEQTCAGSACGNSVLVILLLPVNEESLSREYDVKPPPCVRQTQQSGELWDKGDGLVCSSERAYLLSLAAEQQDIVVPAPRSKLDHDQ
jgi:hypothetical protein